MTTTDWKTAVCRICTTHKFVGWQYLSYNQNLSDMSINESGHVINIANFRVLIDYCKELGAAYTPATADLTVQQLEALYQSAQSAMNQLNTTAMVAKQPINERETLFGPLDQLVTRVLSAYASSNATDAAIADAKGLADKIRGRGLNPRKDKDGNVDPNRVSNAQLSYVQRLDAFKRLVELLGNDASYAPTERELTAAQLRANLVRLEAANEVAGSIMTTVTNARNQRSELLYGAGSGMLDRVARVKLYCKSIKPANPLVVKKIQGIRFKRIPN
jgi:hypothetical protein